MSRRIADLLIRVGADNYEFQQRMAETTRSLNKMSKQWTDIGKQMSLKVTAPLLALGTVSVMMADTQERAEAKVKQAIQSTAGAAKLSFEQLKKYASELQGKTIFGDEKILNESTAQLLTFTNIAGENFKRAQRAALDLATVLDGDLKGVSIQLGKALNDPVRSLAALRKSGIQFSEEQEEVIKKLAQTGEVAKAQSLMLDELERQYGGQAEARAKVGAVALIQLKNVWGDFLEQIGSTILPMLSNVAKALKSVAEWLQNLSPTTRTVIVVIGGLAAAIGPLFLTIGGVIKLLPTLRAGFIALRAPVVALNAAMSANPLGVLLTTIGLAISAFTLFGRSTDDVSAQTGKLTNKITEEGREVNILIAKLTSANSSEADRKAALEELRKIQPAIVEGLSNEKIELETLTKRASEYNQQLVLRIALARKQDQVAAAVERQTEAGVKKVEKEALLYQRLADVQSKLATENIEVGYYNAAQGITRWRSVTDDERKKIIANFTAIMASEDDLITKASKIDNMFVKSSLSMRNFRGISTKELRAVIGDVSGLESQIKSAADEVAAAEKDVKDFAQAFSVSLNTAIKDSAITPEDIINIDTASIDDIKSQIKSLTKEMGKSTDPEKVKEYGAQIMTLKDRLKELLNISSDGSGLIPKLEAQIKALRGKLADEKDVTKIAYLNSEIEKLTGQLERLQKVTTKKLNLEDTLRQTSETLARMNIRPIEARVKIKIKPIVAIADDAKKQLVASLQQIKGIADTYGSDYFRGQFDRITQAYQQTGVAAANSMAEATLRIGGLIQQTFSQLMESMATSIVEGVMALGAGGGNIGDILNNILGTITGLLGQFIVKLGMELMAAAGIMEAFQKAITYLVSQPLLALGVAAAMIAVGIGLQAMMKQNAKDSVPKLATGGLAFGPTYAMVGDNPGARVDPEVIAPLSKLKAMLPDGGARNISLTLGGKFRVTGRDLELLLSRENYKTQLVNGRN